MQMLQEMCEDADGAIDMKDPDILTCFRKVPKAALHLHYFAALVLKWQAETMPEYFDAVD